MFMKRMNLAYSTLSFCFRFLELYWIILLVEGADMCGSVFQLTLDWMHKGL